VDPPLHGLWECYPIQRLPGRGGPGPLTLVQSLALIESGPAGRFATKPRWRRSARPPVFFAVRVVAVFPVGKIAHTTTRFPPPRGPLFFFLPSHFFFFKGRSQRTPRTENDFRTSTRSEPASSFTAAALHCPAVWMCISANHFGYTTLRSPCRLTNVARPWLFFNPDATALPPGPRTKFWSAATRGPTWGSLGPPASKDWPVPTRVANGKFDRPSYNWKLIPLFDLLAGQGLT